MIMDGNLLSNPIMQLFLLFGVLLFGVTVEPVPRAEQVEPPRPSADAVHGTIVYRYGGTEEPVDTAQTKVFAVPERSLPDLRAQLRRVGEPVQDLEAGGFSMPDVRALGGAVSPIRPSEFSLRPIMNGRHLVCFVEDVYYTSACVLTDLRAPSRLDLSITEQGLRVD